MMMERKLAERKKRGAKILARLKKLFPKVGMILKYSDGWELLVAVILSAQCTDKQVNIVTEKLFRKYRSIDNYARVKQSTFEKDIYSTGFYRNKAKSIIAAAKYLTAHHKGLLPKTMEEMLKIPGVGRKTANVVLGNAYNIIEGIAVDTHVMRLARVLDLSDEKTPEKIERNLMKIFPKKDWFRLTYLLIEYGRNYCPARPHDHARCPLAGI